MEGYKLSGSGGYGEGGTVLGPHHPSPLGRCDITRYEPLRSRHNEDNSERRKHQDARQDLAIRSAAMLARSDILRWLSQGFVWLRKLVVGAAAGCLPAWALRSVRYDDRRSTGRQHQRGGNRGERHGTSGTCQHYGA